MCFCFDGQGALTPHRPENCRERGRAEGALPVQISAAVGKPGRLDAVSRSEPIDALRLPRA